MWPPSRRICAGSSRAIIETARRSSPLAPSRQRPACVSAMIAVSRASPLQTAAERAAPASRHASDGAQEAPIEGVVGVFEDDRRLTEPRDQPARDDAGRPCRLRDPAIRARPVEPVLDQRMGVGARQRGAGGAQVPKPAKAMHLARPTPPTARERRRANSHACSPSCRPARNSRRKCARRRSDRRCGCPAARSAGGRNGACRSKRAIVAGSTAAGQDATATRRR